MLGHGRDITDEFTVKTIELISLQCNMPIKQGILDILWLCFNKIISLIYDIISLIDDNINIAIILKTIRLKNIIKLWLQKCPSKLSLYWYS